MLDDRTVRHSAGIQSHNRMRVRIVFDVWQKVEPRNNTHADSLHVNAEMCFVCTKDA